VSDERDGTEEPSAETRDHSDIEQLKKLVHQAQGAGLSVKCCTACLASRYVADDCYACGGLGVYAANAFHKLYVGRVEAIGRLLLAMAPRPIASHYEASEDRE
jgi:hypothetical protein